MVIKSRPWCVITAHKVIKRLPCRAGTLEPGDWGPRSVSHPGPGKPQCPQVAGGRGPGSELSGGGAADVWMAWCWDGRAGQGGWRG